MEMPEKTVEKQSLPFDSYGRFIVLGGRWVEVLLGLVYTTYTITLI
jgi:hypothetical protein